MKPAPSVWTCLAAYASLAWIYVTPVHAQTMDAIKHTIRKKFPAVSQLSTAELAHWLDDTNRVAPLLVDVRTPDEFAVSHLPGAVNFTKVDDMLRAGASTNRPVVVYCSVGYRSSAFADKLLRKRVRNVHNLEGSIFQWSNEGRPVYRGTNVVTQVHPYNSKWGKLLKPRS